VSTENFHPDDGYWLSRYLRFRQNCSTASGPPGPGGGRPGCNMDELYRLRDTMITIGTLN
jgi:hypothetical protein